MTDCAWTEERLPLLLHGDDALSAEERAAAGEHLAGCAACRDARWELEATAEALSAMPHPPVDRARLAAAAAAMTAALDCPREADLVEGGAAVDADHVAGCPVCRVAEVELRQLGRALDLVAAPALTPQQRDRLRAEVTARITRRPAGKLLRLGRWASAGRVAAAALLAANLGLLGAGLARPDDPTPGFEAAMELGLVDLDAARERLTTIAGRGEVVPPRFQAVVERAQREAEALEHLRHRRAPPRPGIGNTAPAALEHPEVVAQEYRDVVVRYPDTLASLEALRRLLAEPGAVLPYDWTGGDPGLKTLARGRTRAQEQVLRYRYEQLAQWIDPRRALDPELRQAALLQRGLHAEALGEVLAARQLYRQALEIDVGTAAARVARERLAALG